MILFLKSLPFSNIVLLILHLRKKRGEKIDKVSYGKSFSLAKQKEALDVILAQGKVCVLWVSSSQPGAILHTRVFDSFRRHFWLSLLVGWRKGEEVLLESSGKRLEMLLNILQCRGVSCLQQRIL